ncbi:hypothetical protein HDE_12185 [Halotydeus destructor]|nr:hypothetical protein HDE_12185 [Halotydeus destructor]
MKVFLYFGFFDLMMAMSLILHIDYANKKLKHYFDQYRDDVIRQKYGSAHDKLLEEVEIDYSLNFTIYSICNIDRKLILAFTAALVNFTVLLIQVSPA